ncbi:MAG: hypothetical protein IJU50_09995 [Lachnospiraceae bacterium]|nr:hypothetical protein [Lachnospiraceae bacterium]
MQMKKCANGHFYDASKNAFCPYCGSGNIEKTVALEQTIALEKTIGLDPYGNREEVNITGVPVGQKVDFAEKNWALNIKEPPVDPVTGWLIGTGGKWYGKTIRLHNERNFIGGANDEASFAEGASAILTCDPEDGSFYLTPGEGDVLLDNARITGSQRLNGKCRIDIGWETFLFLPFVGEGFTWDNKG